MVNSRLVRGLSSEQVAQQRDLRSVVDELALLMEQVVHERVVGTEAEVIRTDVEGTTAQRSPKIRVGERPDRATPLPVPVVEQIDRAASRRRKGDGEAIVSRS